MLKMAMVEKTNGINKYCEDWLPVKNITNGMIQLENGYFVCGIKVEPKNIFILDEGARNNVIVQLRNFYNTIDFEFWMMIADRPVDINLYLAQENKTINDKTKFADSKAIFDGEIRFELMQGLKFHKLKFHILGKNME